MCTQFLKFKKPFFDCQDCEFLFRAAIQLCCFLKAMIEIFGKREGR